MSHDPESILRDVFADRAGRVRPPVGVYAAVRRRHRRQQAVVGSTVAVAVAGALGLPVVALRDGLPPTGAAGRAAPATPTGSPVARHCGTGYTGTPRAVPGLRDQRTAAGSLGDDPVAVRTVLRLGWDVLRRFPESDVPELDVASAHVRMVQRTGDGWIVAVMGATVPGGRAGRELMLAGPDLDHLEAENATAAFEGSGGTALPGRGAFINLNGCVPRQLIVVAPPGSTGTVSWAPRRGTVLQPHPLPLRPDGVAVLDRPVPDGDVVVTVEAAGRTITMHM